MRVGGVSFEIKGKKWNDGESGGETTLSKVEAEAKKNALPLISVFFLSIILYIFLIILYLFFFLL